MSTLIVAYLILVVAAPLVLSAVVSYRTLPEGRTCPLCADDTIRLLSRWLDRISIAKPGAALERRWCPACGWEGVSRNTERGRYNFVGAEPSERAPILTEESRNASIDHEAMDLRNLRVDGRQWRVLVQTWSEDGQWYGRLLFGGPSGRMWADNERTFVGSSPLDLLGQVLSLPEGVLASRLREATSG